MLTVAAGDVRAQPGTVLDDIKGPDSLLLGPTQGRRKSDATRNLSAPPSTSPVTGDAARGREISPRERQELLQNRTREDVPLWGTRER